MPKSSEIRAERGKSGTLFSKSFEWTWSVWCFPQHFYCEFVHFGFKYTFCTLSTDREPGAWVRVTGSWHLVRQLTNIATVLATTTSLLVPAWIHSAISLMTRLKSSRWILVAYSLLARVTPVLTHPVHTYTCGGGDVGKEGGGGGRHASK